MSIIDSASATGELADTGTHSLVVSASRAEKIYVMVDAGTTGSEPATHTITLEGYSPPDHEGRYKFVLEEANKTFRSYRFEAAGVKDRVTVENTSGATATFDITVLSRGP